MTAPILPSVLASILGQPAPAPADLDTRIWPERLAAQIQKDNQIQNAQAWEEAQQRRREIEAYAQRELRNVAHTEQGRALAQSGAVVNYPAALVEAARAAVAAKRLAEQALDTAARGAERWIADYGPTEQLASLKRDEATIEQRRGLRLASDAEEKACRALGAAVERIDQARQVLATLPLRRQDVERQYQEGLGQLDADAQTARGVLREFKL